MVVTLEQMIKYWVTMGHRGTPACIMGGRISYGHHAGVLGCLGPRDQAPSMLGPSAPGPRPLSHGPRPLAPRPSVPGVPGHLTSCWATLQASPGHFSVPRTALRQVTRGHLRRGQARPGVASPSYRGRPSCWGSLTLARGPGDQVTIQAPPPLQGNFTGETFHGKIYLGHSATLVGRSLVYYSVV